MKNSHRLGDGTPCGPTKVAVVHQNTVFIEGKLAARVTDQCACSAPITAGSPTVFIAGQQAARLGDPIACPGTLVPDTALRTYIGDYGNTGTQSTSGAVPDGTTAPPTQDESNLNQVFSPGPSSALIVQAFLDTIAWAEGTDPDQSGDGYDVGFGYRKINNLDRHPGTAYGGSSAAGRYQFLKSTWEKTQKTLNLPDFGPHSQDLGAAHLLKNRGVTPGMIKENFQEAIHRASFEWASLPGPDGNSRYFFRGMPQKARSLDNLEKVFRQAVNKRTTP